MGRRCVICGNSILLRHHNCITCSNVCKEARQAETTRLDLADRREKRARHPQQQRAKDKSDRLKRRDKLLAYRREFRRANADELRKKKRSYDQRNREQILQRAADYRERNREKLREKCRQRDLERRIVLKVVKDLGLLNELEK